MDRQRRQIATLLLVAVISYSGYGFACGSSGAIKSFRLALAASGPLVNALAQSGAIPQSKVTAIIADFDAGAACALTLQSDFDTINRDLLPREITSQKFAAASKALKCFREIINHQNFASHARIQQAANIAEGILASLVVFYSDTKADRAQAEGAVTVNAKSEKDLERQLEAQVEVLKRSLRP